MVKPPERLKRYTTFAAAVDMLTEKRLTLLSPARWDDTNDTAFLEAFRQHRTLPAVFAACFTQAPETYHHWQVFGSKGEGVCVEFDRKALLSSLPRKGSYLWGSVEYMTLQKLRDVKDIDLYELPFIKRYGYRDEKEFRIIYQSTNDADKAHHVSIELSWIKRIILNPWLHESLKPSMQSSLKRIPGCGKISVVQSTLINNAQWKRACDRLDEFSAILGPRPNRI